MHAYVRWGREPWWGGIERKMHSSTKWLACLEELGDVDVEIEAPVLLLQRRDAPDLFCVGWRAMWVMWVVPRC